MEIELKTFWSLPRDQRQTIAEEVSIYSKDPATEGQIAPVEPEDIVFKKQLGVVALHGVELAGYIGADRPVRWLEGKLARVTTLAVLPNHQGLGIGDRLITRATELLLERKHQPYAFATPLSQPGFAAAGYVPSDFGEGFAPYTVGGSKYGNQLMVYMY